MNPILFVFEKNPAKLYSVLFQIWRFNFEQLSFTEFLGKVSEILDSD